MSHEHLTGQVVAVTGGAGGIGRAIAEAMARRGAVVAVIDVDGASATAVARELTGATHRGYRADVTDSGQLDAVIVRVAEKLQGLDVMVNSAGVAGIGRSTDQVSDESWRSTVAVLQDGVFFGMRAAGRVMLDQGHGSVLNIASIRAYAPAAGRLAYCASKAAVAMMTRVAALDWGPRGIRVNAIAPGMTATPMLQGAIAAGHLDEQELLDVTPLGALGAPEDVAGLACWLSSDAARFVTGSLVTVDGGLGLVPAG